MQFIENNGCSFGHLSQAALEHSFKYMKKITATKQNNVNNKVFDNKLLLQKYKAQIMDINLQETTRFGKIKLMTPELQTEILQHINGLSQEKQQIWIQISTKIDWVNGKVAAFHKLVKNKGYCS